ncbi:hypothetical protein ABLE68_14865 [Nocardioides sp. CN2-186]|uniref:hypothetical protein n=1 Tax=Nocardioides tweenelious TaxID=3156607 RepID=UPI0032B32ED5
MPNRTVVVTFLLAALAVAAWFAWTTVHHDDRAHGMAAFTSISTPGQGWEAVDTSDDLAGMAHGSHVAAWESEVDLADGEQTCVEAANWMEKAFDRLPSADRDQYDRDEILGSCHAFFLGSDEQPRDGFTVYGQNLNSQDSRYHYYGDVSVTYVNGTDGDGRIVGSATVSMEPLDH